MCQESNTSNNENMNHIPHEQVAAIAHCAKSHFNDTIA